MLLLLHVIQCRIWVTPGYLGQIRLTQTKCDLVDQDDPTQFQPWYVRTDRCIHMYIRTCFCIILSYIIVNYINIACEPCDSNNNAAIIGAIVGVAVIIIMVITNIMIWIYCLRKKDHTNKSMVTYTQLSYALYYCYIHIGTSSELHKPTKDTINPAYYTITDDLRKKTVEEPVSYEDVNRSPDVKITPNPAYAVP